MKKRRRRKEGVTMNRTDKDRRNLKECKMKYANDKLKNRVAAFEKTLREIRKLLARPIVYEEALRDEINELIDDALQQEPKD